MKAHGHHTRYFLLTITAAYLLAMSLVVIAFVIGKNFFAL